jgi:hypothetical protein
MGTPELHATDDEDAGAFYGAVMRMLRAREVPFLVGGTYALERYAGLSRGTKDLDLFVEREDWPRIAAALDACGLRTELTFSHWLGKAIHGDRFVDFVFAGGNGLVRVDRDWFAHAQPAVVCGEAVRLCAAEETFWSKAFIMERERFDGADVIHLLRVTGRTLDWPRLLRRFGPHWRVLLAHLVLFGFVYPDEHDTIPAWVMNELTGRLREEARAAGCRPVAPVGERVCRGTLLSRTQYVVDVVEWGYRDARVAPDGALSDEQIRVWTEAGAQEAAASVSRAVEIDGDAR